jgi:hypothetical protein
MTTNEYVRAFAGAFVLISLALGVEASPLFVSKHFLWVTGFVGLNLFQSAFTGLCPLVNILHKLGVKDGGSAGAAVVNERLGKVDLILRGVAGLFERPAPRRAATSSTTTWLGPAAHRTRCPKSPASPWFHATGRKVTRVGGRRGAALERELRAGGEGSYPTPDPARGALRLSSRLHLAP